MNFSSFHHFIGSHRFLNRKLRKLQPDVSSIKVSRNFELFLDPKDLYGPSCYVMYDKAAAFYQYEEELKADVVQYLKRGGVFFDVGANIGLISFFVKKFYPESPIVAFEPGKTVGQCLKKTVEVNKISDFTIVSKGVSDKTGVAEFFIDPKSTGGSSLVRKHFEKNQNNIERIELISLDDYIAETNIIPSLIKVDVEGAEELVVAGALKLIRTHKPTFIIESDNRKILENIQLWRESFEGYKFRAVGEKEFHSVSQIETLIKTFISEGKLGTDYLFVPENN